MTTPASIEQRLLLRNNPTPAWIDHRGTDCPVGPTVRVGVKLRTDAVFVAAEGVAQSFDWADGSIVAWHCDRLQLDDMRLVPHAAVIEAAAVATQPIPDTVIAAEGIPPGTDDAP